MLKATDEDLMLKATDEDLMLKANGSHAKGH